MEPLRLPVVTFFQPMNLPQDTITMAATTAARNGAQRGHVWGTAGKGVAAAQAWPAAARVDTNRIVPGESYYAVDPDTIENKLVVAFPGGKETGNEMYCMPSMPYNNLTSR